MNKTYDAAYFQRWYRGRDAGDRAALARKVSLAVATAEFFLQRPIRSVLDVGCGEAAWRAPLLKLRPKLHYQGVDSSEYAVARYGRSRNIALADFGQLEQLRFGAPVDLLICSDVLHYVPTKELRRGLSGIGEHCSGLAFLDLYTREDAIAGDKRGFLPRRATDYRRWFREAGLRACAPQSYLSPSFEGQVAALEAF
jgi:SAM-dependent methyltransferase